MSASKSPQLHPVAAPADLLHHPQLYERIEQRLIDWIVEGRFHGGDRLPSERELALRLGVSRSSVREAIGALQVDGLLETRPGAGSFVAAGAAERLRARADEGRSLAIADASPFAVLEAREALEPSIVRAAAERNEDSGRALQLLERMSHATDSHDPAARDEWSETDRLFHRELAVMSGNAVFVQLADQIADLMDQALWRRLRDDLIWEPGRTEVQLADHRLIYQGIVEGDGEAAAQQALHHIQRVRRNMGD